MAGHFLFFYISNLAKSGLQTLMWSDVSAEEDEAVADGHDAMALCQGRHRGRTSKRRKLPTCYEEHISFS